MSRAIHDSTVRPDITGSTDGRGDASVPAFTVIWHPDLTRVGEVCPLGELAPGQPLSVSRLSPMFSPPGGGEQRPLEDSHLSRTTPAVAIARDDRGRLEIHPGSSDLPTDVHGAPLNRPTLITPAELDSGVILLLARRIVLCLHRIQLPVQREAPMGLVGQSDAMEKVRRLVRRVGSSPVPVLIRGETGTGKELVARALVQASPRADKPFIAVNMAAIPASMAAAELFGHERGAFTGAASARRGHFGEAAGGTLFLDEIGLTPPDLQPMLLRALETGEVLPLGASRGRMMDVRLIAATDADLEGAIQARTFSEPLFQRLAGFQIVLPPLRQRREDFGALLLHFLRGELTNTGELARLDPRTTDGRAWLSASQVAHLAMGSWPGNVRALRNAVRQMVISGREQPRAVIDEGVERLRDPLGRRPPADEERQSSPRPAAPPPQSTPSRAALEIDPGAFLAALRRNRFSPSATAAELGIPRTTVHALMDRHPDIRKPASIPVAELRLQLRECNGDLDTMAERLQVSRRGLQLRLSQLFQDPLHSSGLRMKGVADGDADVDD